MWRGKGWELGGVQLCSVCSGNWEATEGAKRTGTRRDHPAFCAGFTKEPAGPLRSREDGRQVLGKRLGTREQPVSELQRRNLQDSERGAALTCDPERRHS